MSLISYYTGNRSPPSSIPGGYALGGQVLGGAYSLVIAPAVAAPTAPAAVAAATGANPLETQYSIFGHSIPLWVFGIGRIGGELISGPWHEGATVSGGISFGFPADPAGTRTLTEIAFDSEVVWTLAGGFTTESFTFRFYGGSLSQAADALETLHFGTKANAYRPQAMLFIENLPLSNTKFGRFPYVACKISDSAGLDVNFGEAFERLSASPFVDFADFETSGITDGVTDGGMIFTEQAEFLATIQQFGRFYPTWDILQTDKLRIIDRGATVSADITLNTERLMGDIAVTRQGPDTVKKDLELSTIDPDLDYMISPSIAMTPRDPVAVSTSVGKDTAYLPVIMDAFTRTAIVTFAKYHEEATRKTISGRAMFYGSEIEPGTLVSIRDLDDSFHNETFKIKETTHGADGTVEFIAEAILKCLIGDPEPDPYFGRVVLLTSGGDADGGDGTTVVTDESPVSHGVATVAGSAQIDTAQFKYGTKSLLFTAAHPFPGTGDNFSWAPSADWLLGTVWTIEYFVRFGATTADKAIMSQYTGGGAGSDGSWMIRTMASQALQLFIFNGVSNDTLINLPGSSFTTGVWYHHAISSNGTKTRWRIDGVMVGSDTPATTTRIGSAALSWVLGGEQAGGREFSGWLDEVRVTTGIDRYDTDATVAVPSAAYPRF